MQGSLGPEPKRAGDARAFGSWFRIRHAGGYRARIFNHRFLTGGLVALTLAFVALLIAGPFL